MSSQSYSFSLLHPKVQQWITDQGWDALHDIQIESITRILEKSTDLIITAPTASGKTEAAILPILSSIVDQDLAGIRVLYISPLKALIDDQFDRIEMLCERLEIAVTKWHGDISTYRKSKLLTCPNGILLITPESLEALFVLRGTQIARLFSNLSFIIIDELHSFIGMERGVQLQSLLHRLEVVIKHPVRRIGLSATLSDINHASNFLRVSTIPNDVSIVSSKMSQEIRLELRSFPAATPENNPSINDHIATFIFQKLYSTKNLVFPNTRVAVEGYAARLNILCEEDHKPNLFFPHHANLSKQLRKDSEFRLKDQSTPATLICTTTLELGIDVGCVNSIVQIGSPPSVASLRQRLGRSGRRGQPAILRVLIEDDEADDQSMPYIPLNFDLVQSIAMIQLMLKRWLEPPIPTSIHPSTLVHQILSVIAQYNGLSASKIWKLLCLSGIFTNISELQFTELLRNMGHKKLIIQAKNGELLLGEEGEHIINDFHFYSVFVSQIEFRLIANGKEIGVLPEDVIPPLNTAIIFGARRWLIVEIDEMKHIIYLVESQKGAMIRFRGNRFTTADRVRQEMQHIYCSDDIPTYLDPLAIEMLKSGREVYAKYNLSNRFIYQIGPDCYLFVLRGDIILQTVIALLKYSHLDAARLSMGIVIRSITIVEFLENISDLVSDKKVNRHELAVPYMTNKFDEWVTQELLISEFAITHLDVEGAYDILQSILKAGNPEL